MTSISADKGFKRASLLPRCWSRKPRSDPFEEPDALDVERKQNNHVSFGYGRHYCIGAPLARLEIEIAINMILSRFPSLRLASPEVEWYDNFGQRFLKSLPVVF